MHDGSTARVDEPVARPVDARMIDRVRTAIELVRFRTDAVDAVVRDAGAFWPAAAIVALAGVARAAGAGLPLGGYVVLAVMLLLGALLLAAAIHLMATVAFGARGEFVEYFRGFGHAYLPQWLIGIPVVAVFFSWVLWLWLLAVGVLVAERVYKLDRLNALACVVVPALFALAIGVAFNGVAALLALVNAWLF